MRARQYLLTLFIILVLNFLLPRLMPGDPFMFITSTEGGIHASYGEDQLELYRAFYNLDEPLTRQFFTYFTGLLKGDLGYSIHYKSPVLDIILARLVWTLGIVSMALLISTLVGVILGSLSAWYQGRTFDKLLYALMVATAEIPAFIVAVILLFFVAAKVTWIPLAGGMTPFANYETGWDKLLDLARYAFLPILALVLVRLGDFYLLVRNSMLTVISKDYIRTARAKGLSQRRILFGHALKNAILPLITRIFGSFATLFGAAILVENVFHYPGLGVLMQEAVLTRDYPLVQGIFVIIALLVLVMNYLADRVYERMDPRV